MAEAPESDACTDPVVLSFFDTHPNFNSCGYTQLIKAERLLENARLMAEWRPPTLNGLGGPNCTGATPGRLLSHGRAD